MLFKTLWKMILGRTKLALVRAGAPPRCHWQHGGEGTRGAAGQGPDQPGRGTASQRPSPISSKPFPLQPPQCKPGAGWGLALPSSLPLWLLLPGAGVPSGFSSAPSVSLTISSGQLFPIPPSQSHCWTWKGFMMQN